jgi:transmembrane sensor
MTTKKSEELIVKFITNQANQEEIELLSQWLEDVDNQKVFKDFLKTNYAIDFMMNTFDASEAKKKLLLKIRQDNSVFYKRKIQSYFRYAAILIAVLSGFYFYQNLNTLSTEANNIIVPKENTIVLQVDNESPQIIDPTNTQNLTDKLGKIIGKQIKSKLVYLNTEWNAKLVYNTLKIPYGKTFEVELSDGTVAYLNAGSTLRFPTHFSKKGNREVYLTGEGYFDVAKDKSHPFIVSTQEMNIEVLGTKFNVSSYFDDVATDVVLVEGKVSLYKGLKKAGKQVNLTSGLKGSAINGQDKITKVKVNTDYYTEWIKGNLVFKNSSFNDIIKKLERRYSITFINKNNKLGQEVFNARFDNESIETVLKYFSDSYSINYEIKKNIIVIK